MTSKKTSFNGLEVALTVVVPTLALAAYLLSIGAELPTLRAYVAAVLVGAASSVGHFVFLRWAKTSSLRDEVLLQTVLRAMLSVALAVLGGAAVFA